MKKFLFLLILLVIFSSPSLFCQNLPLTAQVFDQKFTLNPSFAGINDYIVATATAQKQWLGMSNSPYTFIASANFKIGNIDFYKPNGLINKTGVKTRDRSGAGVQLYSDQAGFLRNSGMNLSYGYHFPVQKGRLSFGLALKLNQNYFQNDKLRPHQPNDPMVPEFNEVNYFFNSSFGISYYRPYNFYVGLSADNAAILYKSLQKDLSLPEYAKRSYYLLGGKYFHFKAQQALEPFLILAWMNGNKLNSHCGFRYFYKKGCWVGVIEDNNFTSLQGSLGVLIRKFSYCLGYNYYLSPVSKYQNGSIEFSVVARFGDLSRISIY